jgi:hypothetical protein
MMFKCKFGDWRPINQSHYNPEITGRRGAFYVETPPREIKEHRDEGPLLGDTPDNYRPKNDPPMIKS